jgi:hypothetical protein
MASATTLLVLKRWHSIATPQGDLALPWSSEDFLVPPCP